MLDALNAPGPAPDRAEEMMLYGQFAGSWEGRLILHRRDGGRIETGCEVHFGWALEGRAVQDVWIAPPRNERQSPGFGGGGMYGTTLRVYDPENELWEITWVDPVNRDFKRMVGRKMGEDIVQEYVDEKGKRSQWCFTKITGDSFHWVWRELKPGVEDWYTRLEFFMNRKSAG